ncbi:MAG: hypothetical protein WDM90_01070 [Ferruginibacter sp.]
MKKAEELLFEQLFNNRPLFRTQQDLVNQLVDNKGSAYYLAKESPGYQLRINRLKTFISQLLSVTISRSMPAAFRTSLEKVVEERLADTDFEAKIVTEQLITALADRNKGPNQKVFAAVFNPKKQLVNDITDARYVLVITARPFDINDDDSRFSFQQFLIQDLFDSLADPERPMKYYRFNFPIKSLCDLFWLALKKMLEKALAQKMASKDFIEILFLKSLVNSSIYNAIKAKKEITEIDISFVTNELINYLNKNNYVHVFLVEAPIFSVPMIVTNPMI